MSFDWKNWCRLCSKENGNDLEIFVNIDAIAEFKTTIETQFNIFMSNSDGKPLGICKNCYQYIINFKRFCDRCVKSDKMYNWILFNLTNSNTIRDFDEIKLKYELTEKFHDENELNSSSFYKLKIDQYTETETNPLELNEIFSKQEKFDPFFNKNDTEDNKNIDIDGLQNVEVKLETEVDSDNYSLFENNICDSNFPITSNKSSTNTLTIEENKIKVPNKSDKNLNETTVKKKRNRNDEGIFKCERCDKIFAKRSNYRYHLEAKHAGIKLFCSKCPKFFSTKSSLKYHERVHLPDSEKMIHVCTYCNKRFSKAVNMKTHIRTIHINEIGFICDECGKGYKTKAALQCHQLSHSDERPFQCPDCPKRFKSMAMLHIHSDQHSDTKYPCPKCGVTFNTKKSLNFHMVVHTDEKKYKCDYCGNEYKRYKALKYHLNSHTGFRHSCPFCDKTFTNRTNCRNHQKTVHAAEYAAAQLEIEQLKSENKDAI